VYDQTQGTGVVRVRVRFRVRSARFRLGLGQLAPATVNQYPPVQHEG